MFLSIRPQIRCRRMVNTSVAENNLSCNASSSTTLGGCKTVGLQLEQLKITYSSQGRVIVPMEGGVVLSLFLVSGVYSAQNNTVRYEPLKNKDLEVEYRLWREGSVSRLSPSPERSATRL